MPIKDYNTDPDLNTTISGINIAEGCPPSGINNAIRQLMADVKAEKDTRDAAQDNRDAQQDAAIAGKLDKSGGTVMGPIILDKESADATMLVVTCPTDITTPPTTNIYRNIAFVDKNNKFLGTLSMQHTTNGEKRTLIRSRHYNTDGAIKEAAFICHVNSERAWFTCNGQEVLTSAGGTINDPLTVRRITFANAAGKGMGTLYADTDGLDELSLSLTGAAFSRLGDSAKPIQAIYTNHLYGGEIHANISQSVFMFYKDNADVTFTIPDGGTWAVHMLAGTGYEDIGNHARTETLAGGSSHNWGHWYKAYVWGYRVA